MVIPIIPWGREIMTLHNYEFEVIGVDVGTSTIKCSLVEGNGRKLYTATYKSTPLQRPADGFVEIDPDDIFLRFIRIVKHVIRKSRKKQLLLSLSTMAPVFIITNKEGKVIRPAILYNDNRTMAIIEELKNRDLGEKLFNINGNVPNVQMWGPKWLWLKQNEVMNYNQIARMFDLSSYIVYKLTGEFVIDYTIAQEGGLLDYKKRKWSSELLSAFEIDDSLLPLLMKTTDIVSELNSSSKEKLGVSKETSIQINSGIVDSAASLISTGHVSENELSFIIGSTGIVSFSTTLPRLDRRLYLDLSPIEGMYVINGGTAASGLFFDYILELFGVPKPRYKNAEKLINMCGESSKSVVMIPYIQGERTPIFDPSAKSIIFGLTSQVRKCDIIKGALESIAFSLFHHVQILRENGFRFNKIRVTGGLAKNRAILQTLADVMQTEITHYPQASAELGDAFIGFKSLNAMEKWRTIDKWIGKGEIIKPDFKNSELYNKKYKVYLDLYDKLKEDFHFLDH